MSLRMALLGLLISEGTASGYILAKSFSGSLDHVWKASHSQIYPELVKMVDAGLVEVSEEHQPRGAKYYTATAAGRAELERWMLEVEPARSVRNEIALRSFLLSLLTPEQAIYLLEREIEHYGTRTEQLNELRKALAESPGQGFGYFSAELGFRISRAIYEWAEWARSETERQEEENTPAE